MHTQRTQPRLSPPAAAPPGPSQPHGHRARTATAIPAPPREAACERTTNRPVTQEGRAARVTTRTHEQYFGNKRDVCKSTSAPLFDCDRMCVIVPRDAPSQRIPRHARNKMGLTPAAPRSAPSRGPGPAKTSHNLCARVCAPPAQPMRGSDGRQLGGPPDPCPRPGTPHSTRPRRPYEFCRSELSVPLHILCISPWRHPTYPGKTDVSARIRRTVRTK